MNIIYDVASRYDHQQLLLCQRATGSTVRRPNHCLNILMNAVSWTKKQDCRGGEEEERCGMDCKNAGTYLNGNGHLPQDICPPPDICPSIKWGVGHLPLSGNRGANICLSLKKWADICPSRKIVGEHLPLTKTRWVGYLPFHIKLQIAGYVI